MRFLIALTVFASVFISCHTTKSSNGSHSQIVAPLISLHKGACFGTCPVFRFSLYPDGNFIYEALRFHQKHGIYSGLLTKSQVDDIIKKASDLNWSEYPEYIESQIPDLPATTIVYKGKSVQFREEAPEGLEDLGVFLEALIDEAPKKTILPSPHKEYLSNDTLVVDFKANSLPDLDFQTKWRPVIRTITPNVGIEGSYHIVCDPAKISVGQAYYNLAKNHQVSAIKLK